MSKYSVFFPSLKIKNRNRKQRFRFRFSSLSRVNTFFDLSFHVTGAHAAAFRRETVRLHVARVRVAFLPVGRAVPALSVALGNQAVRLRGVQQAVFAVGPSGQTLAGPPQADGCGRCGRRQTAMVATKITTAARRKNHVQT